MTCSQLIWESDNSSDGDRGPELANGARYRRNMGFARIASIVSRGIGFMPYIVTFFFELGKQGWSETYYNNSTVDSKAVGDAAALWQSRGAMLGQNASMTYCRVSDVAVKRDLVLHGNASFQPIKGKLGTCSLAQQALDTKWFTNINTQWSSRLMRGVPDSMFVATNPGGYAPGGAWVTAFNNFMTLVTSGGSSFVGKFKGPVYNKYTTAQIVRACTRRVGRPFGVLRGRKKKKKA